MISRKALWNALALILLLAVLVTACAAPIAESGLAEQGNTDFDRSQTALDDDDFDHSLPQADTIARGGWWTLVA